MISAKPHDRDASIGVTVAAAGGCCATAATAATASAAVDEEEKRGDEYEMWAGKYVDVGD